jgi:hypothetical protein
LNPEVFCYLGLLRFPEQLEASLAVLPELERQRVAAVLAQLKDLPKSELIARWGRQRELEYVDMRRAAFERRRINLDELTPTLAQLCTGWLSNLYD